MSSLTAGAPLEGWGPAPAVVRLHAGEVHTWRASLDVATRVLEHRVALLDARECERASQFRSDRARARYVAARGLLREILGRYLDTRPERLTFRCNSYGKPVLDGRYSDADLRFNLSHSGSIALYAVSSGREIGIDVEERVTNTSTAQIAAQFFSPHEVAALQKLPESTRTRAFFACWTRKEAYVKARGEGLNFPLNQFTVSVPPDEPARLLAADRPGELQRWSMATLALGDRFEGAVVAEGDRWRLRCWNWDEPSRDAAGA
jgi:4'-phosphopantetheinyl transferase